MVLEEEAPPVGEPVCARNPPVEDSRRASDEVLEDAVRMPSREDWTNRGLDS